MRLQSLWENLIQVDEPTHVSSTILMCDSLSALLITKRPTPVRLQKQTNCMFLKVVMLFALCFECLESHTEELSINVNVQSALCMCLDLDDVSGRRMDKILVIDDDLF